MEFEVPIDVPDGWTRQDGLFRRNNPCLTVVVSPIANPALERRCKAILDTGATNVYAPATVTTDLGLRKLNGADTGTLVAGQTDLTLYEGITIRFSQIPDTVFPVDNVSEMPPNKGDVELVLGRIILRHFVLTYDGPAGRVFLVLPDAPTARLRKVTG